MFNNKYKDKFKRAEEINDSIFKESDSLFRDIANLLQDRSDYSMNVTIKRSDLTNLLKKVNRINDLSYDISDLDE